MAWEFELEVLDHTDKQHVEQAAAFVEDANGEWPSDPTRDQWVEALVSGRGAFWFIVTGGERVGIIELVESGQTVVFQNFAVVKRLQRQGLGRTVLAALQLRFQRHGQTLIAYASTEAGASLYAKMGIQVIA